MEIYVDRGVIFPTPFPGEGPISATVQFVTKRDHERIVQQFDGLLTFDDDKIYIEPVQLAPPA